MRESSSARIIVHRLARARTGRGQRRPPPSRPLATRPLNDAADHPSAEPNARLRGSYVVVRRKSMHTLLTRATRGLVNRLRPSRGSTARAAAAIARASACAVEALEGRRLLSTYYVSP